jgi:hypothetical protein
MAVFPNLHHGPELQASVTACFLGSHAGADVLFRLGCDMRFHLFSEPFVAATPDREVEEACE